MNVLKQEYVRGSVAMTSEDMKSTRKGPGGNMQGKNSVRALDHLRTSAFTPNTGGSDDHVYLPSLKRSFRM